MFFVIPKVAAPPLKKLFSSAEAYCLIPTAFRLTELISMDLPKAKPLQRVSPCPT